MSIQLYVLWRQFPPDETWYYTGIRGIDLELLKTTSREGDLILPYGEDPNGSTEPAVSPQIELGGTVHVLRKMPYDTYIGREFEKGGLHFPQSKWHNPFVPGKNGLELCLEKFERHLLSKPGLLADLPELIGKRKACFCAEKGQVLSVDDPMTICHGQVLDRVLRDLYDNAPNRHITMDVTSRSLCGRSGETVVVTELSAEDFEKAIASVDCPACLAVRKAHCHARRGIHDNICGQPDGRWIDATRASKAQAEALVTCPVCQARLQDSVDLPQAGAYTAPVEDVQPLEVEPPRTIESPKLSQAIAKMGKQTIPSEPKVVEQISLF